MGDFHRDLEASLHAAAQDPPDASMLWNVVALAARDHEPFPAREVEVIGGEVLALRDWLGDEWFAGLWNSDARTQLTDWIVPGASGDRPMRTFRAFSASALAARQDDGIDRALATLNRRRDGWHHLLDQLELAALARLSGARVEFEPSIGSGRSDDLLIAPPIGLAPFTVDVSNRAESKADRAIGRFAHELMVHAAGIGTGATHRLRLITFDQPRDYELRPLFRALQVSRSRRGRYELESLSGAVRLVLEPLGPDIVQGIVIEVHDPRGDDLFRARERVETKAKRRDIGSSTWVHLSFFDKLFFATEFASRSMREQARLLRRAVDAELSDGRIRGVVMTTRTRLTVPDGIEDIDERTVAVRVTDDYVTRVVLIVGADHVDPDEVTWWRDVYATEAPSWLELTRRSAL